MKDLTRGNIYKTFFLFGAPLVLSGLLAQAYGIIDTSVAGKLIGEEALAATGATSPLTTFLSSVFWGFGVGFSIYLARLFGEKQYVKIRSCVALSLILQLIAAAIIVAVCLIFHEGIFNVLNVDAAVEKEAFEYYAVYVTGLIFIVFNNTFLFILNAFGISLFQLFMSALSTALNIGGNILLVKCGLGVKGLALASVIAAVVVDICYLIKLRSCYKEMGADKEKIALKGIRFKESFAYSLPNMAQQMVMYLSSLLLSPFVNGMGKSASAAYAVALTLFNLVQAVYCNSSKALSNYAAQCVGLKKFGKIRRGLLAGLLQGLAFTLPFIGVCALFPEAVCSLFFKADAAEETRQYSVLFARVYVPFMTFCMVNNLFHALYRGVKASACLFTSTLVGAAIRYTASAMLIGKYGMSGFYAGWAISWIGETLYAFALFLTNVWNPLKKKKSAAEKSAAE
ncbi:MAG: MATE family efflux transporter [Candidatus Borkfalkiaceae bacterium]|nr:MATE family efflux transporter [Clostridia bacterium]MDY6222599.1 MATE family efflux transporter [Christensenellaceae bacterium]